MKYSGANIVTPFQIGTVVGTIENDVPVLDIVVGTETTVVWNNILEAEGAIHRYRLKSFGNRLFNSRDITQPSEAALIIYFELLLSEMA